MNASRGRAHRTAGTILIAATALASLSLSLGCSQRRSVDGMIVVGMANAAVNLDPRVGTDEASQKAHQLLYNSLLRIDDQLKPVPDLAESLEIEPDELTYVVRLRHGVKFHNGRELTAEDVAYTFNSFLDPAFLSPRVSGLGRVLHHADKAPATPTTRVKEA